MGSESLNPREERSCCGLERRNAGSQVLKHFSVEPICFFFSLISFAKCFSELWALYVYASASVEKASVFLKVGAFRVRFWRAA